MDIDITKDVSSHPCGQIEHERPKAPKSHKTSGNVVGKRSTQMAELTSWLTTVDG